jgi:serine/threonine protein kinase
MSGAIREDGSTIPLGVNPEDSGGTVHSGSRDIPSGFVQTPGGTVHGGGPDITSGYGISPASVSISLNVGEPLIINSITYQYQRVISKSTGEAEIFLLSLNNKKCVFKLYYPNFKPKEDIVQKLKQIGNQDIINVHDYGYYHDRFFEVMDYAEGGTLDKYLPIKNVSRIKQVISETINAFKFCHSNGIIHKDIKPQNLYYKNADGTDILIGDFGISTLLEAGISRHLTSQSLTVGYAAPEMYGVGGKVYIGKEVDYYALGITIIHIWDGRSPFEGLGIHAISNLTTSGKVNIPEDMPNEIQKLVKGLITVDYTKRWGYDEVQRWLKGEDVPIHFQIKEINYPPYQFGPNEAAETAEELAEILKKNIDKGKKHLYSGKLSAWVNLFNQGLAVELDRIIEDDYPKDQNAGIQKAIYILNPDEPYSHGCRTAEELADALEAGHFRYINELSNSNHPFYLYLEAHDAKKEADTFRKYFNTFSAKKALNTIILELRGRESLKLGGELYFVPEELLKYKDQQCLINELKDTESRLSLWIEGSQFHEVKKQCEKWWTLKRYDSITLTYALEKGSPFHFSDDNLAFNAQEFEAGFRKMVQATMFKPSELKTSSFYKEANYWLHNYANTVKDYLDDAYIIKNILNAMDSMKSFDLLKEYFNQDVSVEFCEKNLLPVIQKAIDDKVIITDEVKNCGNEAYLSTWFMRWHFLPHLGIKIGDKIARTPKDVVTLIDNNKDSKQLGFKVINNGLLSAWLTATERGVDVKAFNKIVNDNTANQERKLESILHILNPDLKWPSPLADKRKLRIGRISTESGKTVSITFRNGGRGYLFGPISLQGSGKGMAINQHIIEGGPVTVTLTIKANGLPVGSRQKAVIIAQTNGGTLEIPVSYIVVAPLLKMIGRSILAGLIFGGLMGLTRFLLNKLVPMYINNIVDWVAWEQINNLPNMWTLMLFGLLTTGLLSGGFYYLKRMLTVKS